MSSGRQVSAVVLTLFALGGSSCGEDSREGEAADALEDHVAAGQTADTAMDTAVLAIEKARESEEALDEAKEDLQATEQEHGRKSTPWYKALYKVQNLTERAEGDAAERDAAIDEVREAEDERVQSARDILRAVRAED